MKNLYSGNGDLFNIEKSYNKSQGSNFWVVLN